MTGRANSKSFPPAGSASGGIWIPIHEDDIRCWSAANRLVLQCDSLATEAETISEALVQYSLFGLAETRSSAATPVSEACKQVSEQATNLLITLGLSEKSSGEDFRNCLAGLAPGRWEHNPELVKRSLQALGDAATRFDRARSDALAGSGSFTPTMFFNDAFYRQVAAGLKALKILGENASVAHAAFATRGGIGRGGARQALFDQLLRSYLRLFGDASPGVSMVPNERYTGTQRSSGPTWCFFRDLFRHVDEQARRQLREAPTLSGTVTTRTEADGDQQLRLLAELSRLSHGPTEGGHALQKEIRAAVGRRAKEKVRDLTTQHSQ